MHWISIFFYSSLSSVGLHVTLVTSNSAALCHHSPSEPRTLYIILSINENDGSNLSKRSLYCLMKESDDKVTILIRALAYDKNLVYEMETTTLRFLHLKSFLQLLKARRRFGVFATFFWSRCPHSQHTDILQTDIQYTDFASLQVTNIRGTAVFVDLIFFE